MAANVGLSRQPNNEAVVSVSRKLNVWQRGQWAIPLGIFGLCAIIFTWPLVLHLPDGVINTGGADTWQHLWHVWWVKYSLLDLHRSPYFTSMLYYPTGANLYFDSLSLTTGLCALPFQLVFGLVSAYNLVILFSLTLSGYVAYLLAAYLTQNRMAAYSTGIIFAFATQPSFWVDHGQLDFMPTFWIPLFVLFYLKTLRGERWRLNGSVAAVCFVALSLTTWYFTIYVALIGAILVAVHLVRQRRTWPTTLLRAVLPVAAGAVVLSPVLWETLRHADVGRQSQYVLWLNSQALLAAFTPQPSAFWNLFGISDPPHYGYFLGFGALMCAAVGLISRFRQTLVWAIIGLIAFEYSLGPTLQIGTSDYLNKAAFDSGLPLPNRALYALPFGDIGRIPANSGLVTMLMLGIVAAFGLDRLCHMRRVRRVRIWLPACAAAFIFLEFLPLPRTIASTTLDPFYANLRAEPGNRAVLDLPNESGREMYAQTEHHKPMFGGYTARHMPYDYVSQPIYQRLRDNIIQPPTIFDAANARNTPVLLAADNVGYLVLHTTTFSVAERKAAFAYLQAVFGDVAPTYQSAALTVWAVPSVVTSCTSPVQLAPGGGWSAPGSTGSSVQQTMGPSALLDLYNPQSVSTIIELTTVLQRADRDRLLHIIRDDAIVQSVPVTATETALRIRLELPPGHTGLKFQVADPETVKGSSVRFGSFGVRDVATGCGG